MAEYFNKNFADYEAGFSSRGDFLSYQSKYCFWKGELWLGLRKLYQLTSAGDDYSLDITLTDFDGKSYNAYYDHFQVITISLGWLCLKQLQLDCLMWYRSGLEMATSLVWVALILASPLWETHLAGAMERGLVQSKG